jgi:5,10-methylenetetrahydromethanopterin reductase
VMGTGGPKGEAIARELGDGIFTVVPVSGFKWSVLLRFGTVLEPGESIESERVMLAAGAGSSVAYHRAFELPGAPGRPALADLPGGGEWRALIEAIPSRERHLHTHRGHLTYPNDIDRQVLSGDLIRRVSLTGEASELRQRIADLGTRGVTEIAYQPAGPDIPRELTAFARMAGLASP